MPDVECIYHLVPDSEWEAGRRDGRYRPARLEEDGFVHCTGDRERTLQVAGDYFAGLAEPLRVLAIDPTRLEAELRWEAPAPLPGGGRDHLQAADDEPLRFPHIYGPIELGAIVAVGTLVPEPGGGYGWPERLVALADARSRS